MRRFAARATFGVVPAIAIGLFASGPALAQAAQPPASGDTARNPMASTPPAPSEPEEVTVTARRREEDVQSVPVAVSVIGVQMLENTGTYNVAQLTQLT